MIVILKEMRTLEPEFMQVRRETRTAKRGRSMYAMALASLPFRRAWEILNSRISKAIGRGAADYNFCSYVTQGFGQKG